MWCNLKVPEVLGWRLRRTAGGEHPSYSSRDIEVQSALFMVGLVHAYVTWRASFGTGALTPFLVGRPT